MTFHTAMTLDTTMSPIHSPLQPVIRVREG
jgi:hypothetical protein